MQLSLVSAPTQDLDLQLVTLIDLKTHLRRKDDTSEDDYLVELLTEAREWVESYLGQSLLTQTWRAAWDRDELNCRADVDREDYSGNFDLALDVLMGPVQSVTSVTVYDTENDATVLASTDYALVTRGDSAVLMVNSGAFPTLRRNDCLSVDYVSGETSPNTVKRMFRRAVIRKVATEFLDRDDLVKREGTAICESLDPHRRVRL